MQFRAITISGEVGSGKSSLSAKLIELLPDWSYVNTGQRFRDFCNSKGMSIQQVSYIEDNTHMEFDQLQTKLLTDETNVVVEGRLSGWLARDLRDVFKVYCYAPLEIRIERYMKRHVVSLEEAAKDVEYRDTRDKLKFDKIYGVEDYRESRYYSLVLDTSSALPLELAKSVVEKAGIPPLISKSHS